MFDETAEITDEETDENTSEPSPDLVKEVLEGTHVLADLAEAASIAANVGEEVVQPIGAVVGIAVMVLNVWRALELPNRTCAYQGLCYGLMYRVLDMGDPAPIPAGLTARDRSALRKVMKGSQRVWRRRRNGSTTVKTA